MIVAVSFPASAFAADSLTVGEGAYPLYAQGGTPVSAQAQQSMPDWKGSLFSKKSSTYNNALALKAAELSENAYGGDGGHESVNIRYMLKHYGDNGIIDFKSYNYAKNYSPSGKVTEGSDSSAFTVGHDKLKVGGSTYTILIVVARGTVSDAERVGDINLFDITRKLNGYEVRKNDYDFNSEINKGVEDYVKNHKAVSSAAKKGKLKVLVTGHSLGGAAANLYAAHLDKAASKSGSSWKNHLDKDDIYAYTFGAIKVFMDNGNVEFGYENIHNVYNYYDSFGPHGSKEWLHVSDPKAKFGHTDMFNIGKIEEGSNILDAVHNHDMSRYIEALKAKKVSCSGKQQFKVVFKPNKGLGTMVPQLINRNKKTVLRTVTYQRAGYKFAGWNTNKNGKGKSYKNKQKVKNLAKAGKTVKLYAQWKKAAKVSYLAAYKPVLKSALARTDGFSEYNNMYAKSEPYVIRRYTLWDIDKDGVKELIVHTGFGSNISNGAYVYTIKNGEADPCGTFATGSGFAVASSKGKLYIHGWAGAEFYKLISLKGTKATEKIVCDMWPSDADYSSKKSAFEKKAGLTGRDTIEKSGLSWSDIASTKLLKRADKKK